MSGWVRTPRPSSKPRSISRKPLAKNRIKLVFDSAPNEKEARKCVDKLEKNYAKEVATVHLEHLFIQPDQVLTPTPDAEDGSKPSTSPLRDPGRPFNTLDARKKADDCLYKLIVKTFTGKHADL